MSGSSLDDIERRFRAWSTTGLPGISRSDIDTLFDELKKARATAAIERGIRLNGEGGVAPKKKLDAVHGAVRVRMLVALGADGQYTASGWNPPEKFEGQDDEEYQLAVDSYEDDLRSAVLDTAFSAEFKDPVHCVWVEADIPRPIEQRVRGKGTKTEKVRS